MSSGEEVNGDRARHRASRPPQFVQSLRPTRNSTTVDRTCDEHAAYQRWPVHQCGL